MIYLQAIWSARWIIAALLAMVLSSYGGWSYRDAECRAERADMTKATADALSALTRQYAIADAAAQIARREADEARRTNVQGNVNEALTQPDRGCGWTADDSRLLDATYCASFPRAAGCLLD